MARGKNRARMRAQTGADPRPAVAVAEEAPQPTFNGMHAREAVSRARPIIAAFESRLAEVVARGGIDDGADRLEAWTTAAGIISRSDQRTLVAAAQAGDDRSRELLFACNQRAVTKMAKRYLGQGLAMEDLRQEGQKGLDHAIRKYQFDQAATFLTYATWWIRQYMVRAVQSQQELPSYMHDIVVKVQWALRDLEKRQEADATVAQVTDAVLAMAKTGTRGKAAKPPSEENIAIAFDLVKRGKAQSLDSTVYSDDSDLTRGNMLADETVHMDEELLDHDLRGIIERQLEQLTPLQRTLIERRHGLNGHTETTKSSLQTELGLKKTTLDNYFRRAYEQMSDGLVAAGVDPSYLEDD